MWLSENALGKKEGSGARIGTATIGGGAAGVYTDAERRGLGVYGPGGYVWRPRSGQTLLVLKCGGEDGESCVAGAEAEDAPPDMENGEIYITSSGGASMYLKNDGRILLGGQLYLNGEKLEPNKEAAAL